MQAKPIRIYDLDALFRKELDLEAFRYRKVAVFEGPYGVIVAEEEAVHKRVNVPTDTVRIDANKPSPPGTMAIMPTIYVTLSVDEIKQAPYTDMPMSEFFSRRDYNPRCSSNWRTLLSSIVDIGFDLNGYLPNKQPLKDTIQRAESMRLPPHTDAKAPAAPELE